MDKDTRRKRRTSGQRVAESISINGAKGRSGLHIETCLNGLYPERDQRLDILDLGWRFLCDAR
jgi:hypothetical protein